MPLGLISIPVIAALQKCFFNKYSYRKELKFIKKAFIHTVQNKKKFILDYEKILKKVINLGD